MLKVKLSLVTAKYVCECKTLEVSVSVLDRVRVILESEFDCLLNTAQPLPAFNDHTS